MAPASRVALLLLIVCVAVGVAHGRFIIAGDTTSADDSWTQNYDYTNWTQDNPLYEGDVVVFKYPAYWHVVWELGSMNAWENCIYDNAQFIGNDTAGVGNGFWVTATNQPQYLACGVFGHCELGQKIIVKATLGPLPASMKYVDVPPPPPPFVTPPPGTGVPPPLPPHPAPGTPIGIFPPPPPPKSSSSIAASLAVILGLAVATLVMV